MCPFMDRAQRWVALRGRVVRPELVMTLPRSAADVLADHVLFEIQAIDRMYLNLYAPAATWCRGRRVLRRAPRSPVRVLGADGPDDEGVYRGHRPLHRRSRAGPGAVRPGAAQGPGHRRVPAAR